MTEWPKALTDTDYFQEMLRGAAQTMREREERAAKADPVKHKLSNVFENTAYRYYRTKDGRGREVRFCYSCHRNVAGYFLAWREVINKDGSGKRDGWIANRRKQTLIERQRKLSLHSPDRSGEAIETGNTDSTEGESRNSSNL